MNSVKPVPIAFVLPSFAAGGAQRVMITLASQLDRARFSPFFVVFENAGPWRSLLPLDLPVMSVGKSSLRAALPGILKLLRHERPDIIVSTLSYVNAALLLVKPLLPSRSKLIVREANTSRHHTKSLVGKVAYTMAYRYLYPRADRIICPASYLADELTERFGLDRKRIAVIGNPVDELALRNIARTVMKRAGAGRLFVAVGRLEPQKGYDRLLDDFSYLPADSHLVIFGEGELRAQLTQRIKDLGLNGRAILAGFEPQPGPWIAGADALVLPSRWEGLPNVALEALACGTKVISTPEAGGIGEIAANATAGAVTIAESGSAFIAAMEAVSPRSEKVLYPSLLPRCYRLEEVGKEFEKILMQ